VDFGKKVRIIRVLRGLSGEDLALRTGIDRTVIVRHEATEDAPGARGPRQKTLDIYARGLHVPKDVLEDDAAPGWQDVFRPISPFVPTAPEVYSRISADLRQLLPPFFEHIRIVSVMRFKCERGGVISVGGNECRLVLVLPLNLYQDLADVFASPAFSVEDEMAIDEGVFVSFFVNPAGTVSREDVPDGLKMDPVSFEVCDFYRPPELLTKIAIELAGNCEDVSDRVSKAFKGYELKALSVEKPANWRETMLPEVADYIRDAGLEIGDDGELKDGDYSK